MLQQIVDYQCIAYRQGYLEHIQTIRCLIIDVAAKFDEVFEHLQSSFAFFVSGIVELEITIFLVLQVCIIVPV